MKLIATRLALAAIASFTLIASPRTGAELPQPAPAWEAADLQGKSLSLEQFKGKVIVLNFWGTWCIPCRKEIPDFVATQQTYGPKGLVTIGAAMDEGNEQAVTAFAKKYFLNYPIVMASSTLTQAYEVVGAPTTVIIDRQGMIRFRRVGAINRAELEKQIAPLL